MVRKCAVPHCSSTDNHIMAHRFPRKMNVAVKWQESLNLEHIPIQELCHKYIVCTLHFTRSDYRNAASKNLNITAVPTLFDEDNCMYEDSECLTPTRHIDKDPPRLVADEPTHHNTRHSSVEYLEASPSESGMVEEHIDEYEKHYESVCSTDEYVDSVLDSNILVDQASSTILEPTPQHSDVDDDPGPYIHEDDNNEMIYDTGILSFPDPGKDLPEFSHNDFLLESPTTHLGAEPKGYAYIMEDKPVDNETNANLITPFTMDFQQANSISNVDNYSESDSPFSLAIQQPNKSYTADDNMIVSIDHSVGEPIDSINKTPSPAMPISFQYAIHGQLSEEPAPFVLLEPIFVPEDMVAADPVYVEPEVSDDEEDVFTDEMRLYSEMSKKCLVQLMVKANGKIRQLEERLETIESAHNKVLGSLELFRSVLKP